VLTCNKFVAVLIWLRKTGIDKASVADIKDQLRVIEYPGQPFFIGTLFMPQTRCKPEAQHPLVTDFQQAATDGGGKRHGR
jgi:CTP synthase (UTP-ammonia lyase)